jgi:hypothetical protein
MDILIHNSSCSLNKHKLASISYPINRLHTYSIPDEAKTTELEIIKKILHNNQYKYTHTAAKQNEKKSAKQEPS